MAKATVNRPPPFVARLEAALQRELPGAEITTEHVRGRRYRFVVVSDEFSGVGHPERQRRVWDIAEAEVPRPDLLDVGMILTIAPEELPKE
jgi:acid stress-induced BolA-like protein IbaG/YrbA